MSEVCHVGFFINLESPPCFLYQVRRKQTFLSRTMFVLKFLVFRKNFKSYRTGFSLWSTGSTLFAQEFQETFRRHFISCFIQSSRLWGYFMLGLFNFDQVKVLFGKFLNRHISNLPRKFLGLIFVFVFMVAVCFTHVTLLSIRVDH